MPSATVKYNPKQRAQDRARILQILLTNRAVAGGILGRVPAPDAHTPEQDIAEIVSLVARLPAPDLADVLEALPTEERHALWSLVKEDKRGHV